MSCTPCNLKFERPEEWKTHLKTEHLGVDASETPTNNDQDDQELHLQKKEDQDGKLKCELCVETFEVGNDLLKHLFCYHNKNLIEGGKCDETCQTIVYHKADEPETKPRKIAKNTTEIKAVIFKCGKCKQEFKYKSALKSHTKFHMDQTPSVDKYKCDLCFRMFTTKQGKSLHQTMMHAKTAKKGLDEKDKSKFQCDHCGWKHISKTKMSKHLEDMHSIYPLKRHISEVKKEDGVLDKREDNNECNQCEYKCESDYAFGLHMEQVHGKSANLNENLTHNLGPSPPPKKIKMPLSKQEMQDALNPTDENETYDDETEGSGDDDSEGDFSEYEERFKKLLRPKETTHKSSNTEGKFEEIVQENESLKQMLISSSDVIVNLEKEKEDLEKKANFYEDMVENMVAENEQMMLTIVDLKEKNANLDHILGMKTSADEDTPQILKGITTKTSAKKPDPRFSQIFLCDNCERVFATQTLLNRHIECDHLDDPHEADESTIEPMDTHNVETPPVAQQTMDTHNVETPPVAQQNKEIFKCSKFISAGHPCRQPFENKENLQKHIQEHTELTCPTCGEMFKNMDEKNIHMKMHVPRIIYNFSTGINNCNNCLDQFDTLEELKVHVDANHKDKSQNQCKFCELKFQTKNDLRNHVTETHKTFKPCNKYAINNCEYDDECRYQHITLRENQEICFKCGEIFSNKTEMMKHVKGKHGEIPCTRFSDGHCEYGSKCLFKHVMKTTNQATHQVFRTVPLNPGSRQWQPNQPQPNQQQMIEMMTKLIPEMMSQIMIKMGMAQ